MNGCKLSFFVQMQYYWRISQSHFYVNLYRKELCNDEFYNIATVAGSLPNVSASHLFVRFFSAKTTLMRLMSLVITTSIIDCGYKGNK